MNFNSLVSLAAAVALLGLVSGATFDDYRYQACKDVNEPPVLSDIDELTPTNDGKKLFLMKGDNGYGSFTTMIMEKKVFLFQSSKNNLDYVFTFKDKNNVNIGRFWLKGNQACQIEKNYGDEIVRVYASVKFSQRKSVGGNDQAGSAT